MVLTQNHPRHKLSFVVFIALVAIVIWLLLRLVLWVDVGITQLTFGQSIKAFGLGLWFDLNALCYFAVPFLLISLILPNKWRSKAWVNKVRWGLAFLVTFGLLFGAVSEYIFWQEFTTRFNFIAVDYLIYTNEVIGNIRESYPVPLILFAIALVALGILIALRNFISFDSAQKPFKQKAKLLIAAVALPVISFQLANVDQMEFGQNAYANELAGNGVYSFSAAARRNELDYDKFYKTIPQSLALSTLKSMGVNRQSSTTEAIRDISLGPFKRPPKNVILISVESLSADYMGTYGSKENLTPYLDKLAGESLVFDKLFATGTRTVRGLDALSIGIPPIPGQAIVHRPNNDHLAGVGEILREQNYETMFIYGGYGVFDNMNNYFKANDYKVVDRTDFDAKSIQAENVWGVDDESLFNNSIKLFDQLTQASDKAQKPFFAHIMTTSNHRPFTFPEGKIDLPQGHREGAVKYTDYALGKLIENAKSKPWFKDTLFVIVADHCSSAAGKTKLPVDRYHIPLFFYAPDILPAGHYGRVASQIDIVPTLLDVLGMKGAEHFYGQSMFAAEFDKLPERAFISNYQELGYYTKDILTVLSPKQKTEAFKVDRNTLESVPTSIDETLLNEAIAYYQTANRDFKSGALKHN